MSPIISGLIGGLISVVLTAYIANRVGKGGQPGHLRFGWFIWALAVGCLALALLPIASTLAGNNKDLLAKVALFIGFGLGSVYSFGEAAFVRGTFDEHGIQFHTPWTGTKKEIWSDLRSVEFVGSCCWYTLTFANGKKVRLSQYLQGHMLAVNLACSKIARPSDA